MNKDRIINLGIAFLFCIIYILLADWYSFPWCDEIYFSGPAANFIYRGEWFSAGIGNPYPPFYSLILAGWFLLFGVTHLAAVALEIVLAFFTYIIIYHFIECRGLFNNPFSYYLLLPLFWLGFYLPTTFTMGRTDMLVMLLMLVILDEIIPVHKEIKYSKWKLFGLSFLLSFTAIYPLPFIVFVLIYLFLFSGKENRKCYFKIGLLVLSGIILGLMATVLFAYQNDFLLAFVSWLSGGAAGELSFTEKLLRGYSDVPTLVLFIIALLLFIFKKNDNIPRSLLFFVVLIPLLMVLVGRYERYYWWMMYVPTFVLFINLAESKSKAQTIFTFVLITVICLSSQLFLVQYPQRYHKNYFDINYTKTTNVFSDEMKTACNMVVNHQELIKKYNNMVFVSEYFYYPLAKSGSCWFINNGHFPESTELSFVSHDTTKFYWRIYEKYIRGTIREVFPAEGVFFSINSDQSEACVSFLERENYATEEYEADFNPQAKMIVFKKNVH